MGKYLFALAFAYVPAENPFREQNIGPHKHTCE